jgi:NAD(P)-dependent dehydrogenase (short-subunit alcohol dehydrogenase family)
MHEDEVPERFSLASSDGVTVSTGVDLTRDDDVSAFFASVPELWASVHLAGGFHMSPLLDSSGDDFEAMWRINTLSCFLSCREAVRAMRAGKGGGRIVNVAARPALEPVAGMSAYSASKAGVVSLTESIAREVKDDDILVNAIVPSVIDTPANRAAMPKADHDAWPKPSELAWLIASSISPTNRVCSGALLPAYGKQL